MKTVSATTSSKRCVPTPCVPAFPAPCFLSFTAATRASRPVQVENGGPLVVERIHYAEGRGNVIVKYPGTSETATVGIVGRYAATRRVRYED